MQVISVLVAIHNDVSFSKVKNNRGQEPAI